MLPSDVTARRRRAAGLAVLLALGLALGAPFGRDAAGQPPRVPTLFIIGDSTVRNNTKGQQGWGDPLAGLFDKTRIKVENRALGGRSSRTFLSEGLWDKVLAALQPGDFVLMQFGHNDGGPIDTGRARASLKGGGDDTKEVVDAKSGKKEVVHTYGWYMRKYCADAKAKGATPIVLSPIPRNIWKDGKVARAANDYGKWAAEAARAEGVLFVDLNELIAVRYEKLGQEKVDALFFGDHTHTNPTGAKLNAEAVVEGLQGLKDCALCKFLAATNSTPCCADEQGDKTSFKFQFGPGKAAPGYTQVPPAAAYTKELGYGFDLGAKVSAVDRGGDDALRAGFCTSDKPFFFSVAVPEGNYNVTLILGDSQGESTTTVRAESRRLMLEKVPTAAGKFETRTITVNVRTSKLASGGQVKLKDRELNGPYGGLVLHWDDKLTLEFAGPRPCLCAMEIAKVDDAITVYLAGDSTVTDQTKGAFYSWGQILPRFFKPGVVAVANHAESGEATTSFIGAKRLEKILDTLKKGDYLLVQFGHNDQNQKRDLTTYKDTLKRYVAEARKRDAVPVLVTPMRRRTFDAAGQSTNTLAEYAEAVRQTARDEKVMLIDLNAMSKDFYEALGPTNSKSAFVDNTHTNDYGAYEFARYVAETVKNSDLGLARHVVEDLPAPNFKAPAR